MMPTLSKILSKRGAATTIQTIFPSSSRMPTSLLLLSVAASNVTHVFPSYVRRVNSQYKKKFTGPATAKHSHKNRASRSMSSQVSLLRRLNSLLSTSFQLLSALTRKFPVKRVPRHFPGKLQNGSIFDVSRIPPK